MKAYYLIILSNFLCVIEMQWISLVVTLALSALLSLNLGFPCQSVIVMGSGGTCVYLGQLRGRGYFFNLFFKRLKRAFALGVGTM